MPMKRKSSYTGVSRPYKRGKTTGIGRAIGDLAGYMVPGGGVLTSALGGAVGDYAEKKLTSKAKAFSNESTLSTRHAVSRKKGSKLNKKNAKKTVKVSKALRAKIGKVIEEKKAHGSWTQISFGYIERPTSCAQQVQAIQQFGSQDFGGGWQFLPEQIIHCASVLFNGKADSQGTRPIGDYSNLGMVRTILDGGIEAGQPEQLKFGCNAKIHVANSYEQYHMKNNTQQTLKVRVYTCATKNVASSVDTTVLAPSGAVSTGNVVADRTPQITWNLSLATKNARNVLNADEYRIGMRPESDPIFKRTWSYEITEVILDPGQSHTINIQGPKNADLDFSKYFKNNFFETIQKYSRYTFFIVETDLIQGSGTTDAVKTVGRFKLNNATGALLLERKMHLGISVPQSAGITTSGSNANTNYVENATISSRFAHVVYAPVSPTNLQRIDEENPVVVEL